MSVQRDCICGHEAMEHEPDCVFCGCSHYRADERTAPAPASPRLMVVPTTGEIHTECPDCRHAGCTPYEPMTPHPAKPEQPPVTAQRVRDIVTRSERGPLSRADQGTLNELADFLERRQ